MKIFFTISTAALAATEIEQACHNSFAVVRALVNLTPADGVDPYTQQHMLLAVWFYLKHWGKLMPKDLTKLKQRIPVLQNTPYPTPKARMASLFKMEATLKDLHLTDTKNGAALLRHLIAMLHDHAWFHAVPALKTAATTK